MRRLSLKSTLFGVDPICRDVVEPSGKRAFAAKIDDAFARAQKCILRHFLRVLMVAEQAVGAVVDFIPVGIDQFPEGAVVSVFESVEHFIRRGMFYRCVHKPTFL